MSEHIELIFVIHFFQRFNNTYHIVEDTIQKQIICLHRGSGSVTTHLHLPLVY